MEGLGINLYLLTIACSVRLAGSDDSQIIFLSSSETLSGPVGANITFPCTLSTIGTSVVTWYKGDQVLSANDFIVLQDGRLGVLVTPGTGVHLTISNLQNSDAGFYTCAVNIKEKVMKLTHQLLINRPPAIHTLHPGGQVTVAVGSKVTLQCKAEGHPRPTIFWTREHNLAFPGYPFQHVKQGDTLELVDISREYGGGYLCNADNGVKPSPAHEAIHINVLYPPEVTAKTPYHHVRLGDTVTLVCVIFANPPPKVTWYKSTMKLQDGERIVSTSVGNSYKLSIDSVNIQDFGEYTCRVENSLKKDVSKQMVLSGCPPPPEVLSDAYSQERYSYELLWTVQSHYPITSQEIVLWPVHQANVSQESFEGEETKTFKVSGGDSPFSYNFKGLKNNATFRLQIRSRNEFGWGPFSSVFSFNMFPREKLPMEIKDSKKIFEKNAPLTSDQNPSSAASLAPLLTPHLAAIASLPLPARFARPPLIPLGLTAAILYLLVKL